MRQLLIILLLKDDPKVELHYDCEGGNKERIRSSQFDVDNKVFFEKYNENLRVTEDLVKRIDVLEEKLDRCLQYNVIIRVSKYRSRFPFHTIQTFFSAFLNHYNIGRYPYGEKSLHQHILWYLICKLCVENLLLS